MAELRWTLQAADDLESIAEFISLDSPYYANLFVLDMIAAAERASAFPLMGREVPEASDAMIRELLIGSYRLIYRVLADGVEIITLYHGARLLDPKKFGS